jgi:Ca2+-dependent lipid-binding protein
MPAKDSNGKSDPFCTLELFPRHGVTPASAVTKVQKKTLAPDFNEVHHFTMAHRVPSDVIVRVLLEDHDTFSSAGTCVNEGVCVCAA